MSSRRVASHFHFRRAFDTKQWGPFQFEIDRPRGFVKTWDLPDGSKKSYEYPVDYGYFVGHTGEDDEGLDAFVGSDPAAPIESFLKLMPGPDGGLVPDETKFLVGLTPEERVKVMALYRPEEVVGMRTYTDFYDLLASLNAFRTRKQAALRVAAMATQARTLVCGVCGSQLLGNEDGEAKHSCPKCKTAAKTLSPDDVKALMLKIRKGTLNQSPAELAAVLETLGWTVTPTVGLKKTEDGTFFYAHTPAQADEMMALLAKAKVSSWPVNPKAGGVYITEYSRSPSAGNGETVDYKGAVGLPGVILKTPKGVSGIALATYSAEPHRYLNGDAKKKPTLSGTDMIWWLEENVPTWKDDVLAYLNMEEHVPANARTRDRTGTCGICFQNVKLNGNTGLAHHGFKRPGGGYTTGECPGMRFPPFELSVDATAAHLRGLEEALKDAEADAGDIQQQGKARSLRTDIAIYRALVDHWKPRALPVEGEKMQNWYDKGRMASTVAGRYLEADLSPPLGGGPCRVVERIEDMVRDPKLREKMIDDVEQGHSLANEESKRVYPFSRERGSFFKTFTLVPHAAYRMDWRGVTVKDVEAALNSFAAHMKGLKEKRDPAYERTLTQSEIAWVDPKTKLQVVFGVSREGEVKVISAYWKGQPDPKPTACNIDRVAARFLAGD